jgi:hypothetical protein
MANTYTLIASSTVGSGGAASIDFQSIPATYTDLCLKLSLRSAGASTWDSALLQINTSSSDMSSKYLSGNGSTVVSGSLSSFYLGDINAASSTSDTFTNQEIYLPNYTAAINKSGSIDSVAEQNASAGFNQLFANLWSQTTAINRLTIVSNNGFNLVQYSTAYLYGIKNS